MVTLIITIIEQADGNVHTQLRTDGVQAIKPGEGHVLNEIRKAIQGVAGKLVNRIEIHRDNPPPPPSVPRSEA